MLASVKTPPVLSVISLLRPHWKAASGGFYSELHSIQFREDEPVTAALC